MRNIQHIDRAVKTVKALAEIHRLRAIAALMYQEELCVCQITELLGLAPSTVSRHIRLLEDAHLIKSRKEGRWIYYKLSENISPELKSWLENRVFETVEVSEDRKKLDEILARDSAKLCR
ncbi:MAG: ArsR/SmtB family transcription factor [Elusimicrobiota bacterium]